MIRQKNAGGTGLHWILEYLFGLIWHKKLLMYVFPLQSDMENVDEK